jgi:hypothetical protein
VDVWPGGEGADGFDVGVGDGGGNAGLGADFGASGIELGAADVGVSVGAGRVSDPAGSNNIRASVETLTAPRMFAVLFLMRQSQGAMKAPLQRPAPALRAAV